MRYATIVADPPWPINWTGGPATRTNGRGEVHANGKFGKTLEYKTMPVADIAALPVAAVSDEDANLFLWTTDGFLLDGSAREVVSAWGFASPRLLIWEKTGFGLGTFPRPQHEVCVVATRGRETWLRRDVGSVHTWKLVYENGGRKHSAKPDGFHDLVESSSPGPYLEMFARRARFGWDYWGDESLETAELFA